ncbi:GAF and ANTAR domain-containing protein [Cellulomonas shaoxiangyii]|uniref:ANTAR domain-containing protein n=1 Tax=Cellulomonas shaoxiangyii TaxID=2566013 RepID=A0A4V1CMP9_9CELL|nr:GAF and ANTAR domain-containing protein [Cellulomonas shaoxiangyii]QCB93705.1 ANTAR domain-containing protein [Cellulomonas shaoxiangyii]TGY86186.1 ANTAR domain-containing protein [Cellulomonas shaoxiangyii]
MATIDETQGSAAWASPDLEALHDLLGRVDPALGADGLLVLQQELETATEELRVADAQMHAHRAELDELLTVHHQHAAQREWMASQLPVPLLVTDRNGLVEAANAAAARGLNIAHGHLLRKPLVSFVDDAERPAVRRLLSSVGSTPVRLHTRLRPRRSPPVPVEVVVVADGAPGTDAHLTWTVVTTGPDDADPDRAREALRLATAFVTLGWLATAELGERALLGRIAEVITAALPGQVDVSVDLGSPAAPTVVASSGLLAATGDGLQIRAGEGPCITAFDTGESVVSPDITTDARWTRLADAARGEQVRSVMAVPVVVEGAKLACLNCYSTEIGAFRDHDVRSAELLATSAGAVLVGVQQKERLRQLGEQLSEALTSRAVIDQAKGIVMAARGGTADEAFRYMSQISQRQNVRLRLIAQRIVDQAQARKPALPDRPRP